MHILHRHSPAARSGGFTLVEAVVVTSVLLMGLLAMTSTSVTVHALRETDREHRLAADALASLVEDVRSVSNALVAADPSWSQAFVAAWSPGGEPGDRHDVAGLTPVAGEPSVASVRIVTDETLTDAELGVELGMPRDLDNDGAVDDPDVAADAVLLPVVVTLRWHGASGARRLEQAFYVVGL